jgi:DGQHR domain-containing protein
MMLDSGRSQVLRLNSLRVEQRPDVPLFVFGVNGRLVHQFASVQGAERTADGVLAGYQRARVERHIREIHAYLAGDDSMLPNAIVLALGPQVNFTTADGFVRSEWGTLGCLTMPLPRRGEAKPCLIVDGQQRVAALAQLDPRRQFPVVVIGFQSSSNDLQREQFVLVNKTKPLPRDLLNELLPHVGAEMPRTWQMRRVAAGVVERLRFDKGSPFYGRIRGLGSSGEGCNISLAAVIAVVEGSVRRGGALAAHFSLDPDPSQLEAMAHIVSVFFGAVSRVWPFAWNENPRTSRLVHGVGIVAMGRLMDVIMVEVNADSPRAVSSVERRLRKIETRCAWTSGSWSAPLSCSWDQLQNTSQDKRRLADYLVEAYRGSARNRV